MKKISIQIAEKVTSADDLEDYFEPWRAADQTSQQNRARNTVSYRKRKATVLPELEIIYSSTRF